MNNYTCVKMALVGDAKSGKTSICRMLAKEGIEVLYNPTLGIDLKFIYIHDHKLKVTIHDLSGLKQFRNLNDGYVKNCEIIAFCYSSVSPHSFQNMTELFHRYMLKGFLTSKKIMVIATKIDASPNRDYLKKGLDFCNRNDLAYFETCAIQNIGKKVLLDFVVNNFSLQTTRDQVEFPYCQYKRELCICHML